MGISTNVYTFYGVKIGRDDKEKDMTNLIERLYESFEEELDEGVNFDFVVDEEYIVIGKNLFDSGDFRYGYGDDINEEFCEVNVDSLKQEEDSIKENVKDFDVNLWKKIENEKFKIISFIHFS